MGSPIDKITIKSLSKGKAHIKHIEMLGSKERLSWKQDSDRLVIEKPKSASNDIAVVFKIQMSKGAVGKN